MNRGNLIFKTNGQIKFQESKPRRLKKSHSSPPLTALTAEANQKVRIRGSIKENFNQETFCVPSIYARMTLLGLILNPRPCLSIWLVIKTQTPSNRYGLTVFNSFLIAKLSNRPLENFVLGLSLTAAYPASTLTTNRWI